MSHPLIFAGLGGTFGPGTVAISNQSPYGSDFIAPYNGTYAGIRLTSGGQYQTRNGKDGDTSYDDVSGEWIDPLAAASRRTFHVKFAYTGDALNGASDVEDTWLELSSSREWFIYSAAAGSKSGSGTLSISDDGGSTTLDTAAISLSIDNL
jgi:hypothetical protein